MNLRATAAEVVFYQLPEKLNSLNVSETEHRTRLNHKRH
jgi:hypothetical protein